VPGTLQANTTKETPMTKLHLPASDGEAEIGERITVLDLTTSAVDDYRLVSTPEGRPAEGEISIHSLLGSALLGRHVGDVISVPDGVRTIRLEVVEVDG
jgi:transcription elongation GreA/GreB family factor